MLFKPFQKLEPNQRIISST